MAKKEVNLVFERTLAEIPTVNDTLFARVSIEIPDRFDMLSPRAIFLNEDDSENIPAHATGTIVERRDINALVGQLLTYVDATFSDPEQRKAHKDIIKQIVYQSHLDWQYRATEYIKSAQNVASNEDKENTEVG